MPDGLGPDNSICITEFIEAARAQVLADNPDNPEAADNLDDPQVRSNFEPLGMAVYQIATARARTISDATADADFWSWVAAVNDWLQALAAWQQSLDTAFANWAPAQPAEQNLRNELLNAPDPGAPPATPPDTLEGRIE